MAIITGRLTKLKKEHRWPRIFATGPSRRWKRLSLRFSAFLDDVAFHILYFVEAIVIASGLCCGCHI